MTASSGADAAVLASSAWTDSRQSEMNRSMSSSETLDRLVLIALPMCSQMDVRSSETLYRLAKIEQNLIAESLTLAFSPSPVTGLSGSLRPASLRRNASVSRRVIGGDVAPVDTFA